VRRSAELTPLSHDHHQALFVAQRLKRDDARDARERFLEFWGTHGEAHFAIEEAVLLPGWIEADPSADHELAARVASEHLAIRVEARRLERGELPLEALRALGDALERHVRFEERELFPLIEASLEVEELERLGAEIAAAEGRGDAG
jgi:hemerythrin-like domain-containing protein